MSNLPKTQRRLVVRKLSTNFREAVRIETVKLEEPKENEILVKNKYVGINADDINVSSGVAYYYNISKDVPFEIGFEGIGTVAAIGKSVTGVKIGDSVAYIEHNIAYAEYVCISKESTYSVPAASPEYLVLVVSGITACVGLQHIQLKCDEKVLITAASGGLGHMAVQLAKNLGCFVIGTCASKEKQKFLLDIGCDHAINYKENASDLLSKHYPQGIDVIWDAVGGDLQELGLKHIAKKGRFLVIGGTSKYMTKEKDVFSKDEIYYQALSVMGCNADLYSKEYLKDCYRNLLAAYEKGDIKPVYILRSDKEEFFGLEGIIKAVEYLYQGKHCGKIIAQIY